jgi:DHA1 family tetracycline resistance protein-like MFS transporter
MNRKPSMLVVFLTVFIDLIGFGIVVPLVPLFSRHYGASGFVIGAIIASFSAMQFVFAPIWGKLSDRHGRRPILLISTAGAALSYVLFALGSGFENHTFALWTLLVSRMFAGACGGSIVVGILFGVCTILLIAYQINKRMTIQMADELAERRKKITTA